MPSIAGTQAAPERLPLLLRLLRPVLKGHAVPFAKLLCAATCCAATCCAAATGRCCEDGGAAAGVGAVTAPATAAAGGWAAPQLPLPAWWQRERRFWALCCVFRGSALSRAEPRGVPVEAYS